MPRRILLSAQLLNQLPGPVDPLPRRLLEEPVWASTVWLIGDEERVERIPARLLHRAGDLALCAWFEPRVEGDRFWLHADDVTPRVATAGRPATDPRLYRYPQLISAGRDAE